MGCGSCAAAAARAAANRRPAARITPEEQIELNNNCEFNNTTLQNFKSKLNWFKESGRYLAKGVSAATLNRYIGVTLTSINIKNKCQYRDILFQIQDLVNVIINEQNA